MPQNGVIEVATGDLLRCGFGAFTAGVGEAVRTDVPVPAIIRGRKGALQMNRWNGASWILVAQPGSLRLTSNQPLNVDGVPVALSNGVAVHTLTIQKVDANGTPILSGGEQLKLASANPWPISDTEPTLDGSGQAQVTIGPIKQVAQSRITASDPNNVLRKGSITLGFSSKVGSKEPIRSPNFVTGAALSFLSVSTVGVGMAGVPNEVRDSTNQFDMTSTGQIVCDITTTGVNGLMSGLSEQADTWYAVLVIGDTNEVNPMATMLVDAANLAAPTLPAGYDVFRRVGWVRNNGSSDFIPFFQSGHSPDRTLFYDDRIANLRVLNGGSSTAFTDVDLSVLVPPVGATEVFLQLALDNALGNPGDDLRVRPKGSTVNNFPTRIQPGVIVASSVQIPITSMADGNQLIQYRVSRVEDVAYIVVAGYKDDL